MATKKGGTNGSESQRSSENTAPTCGIVMPIGGFDDCSEEHWYEVRQILTAAIEDAGFSAVLVSDADDIGVIQKRIIQNVYSNPIIVCDVSGKNPNVMFELGLRLAFDKPAIIVKDDKTSYSFDTAPIEHLEYPRDLRFSKIVEFQGRLSEKIRGTHKRATTDPNYTTFLKHFGTFSVPKLETKEVSKEDFILEELRTLKSLVVRPTVTPKPQVSKPKRDTNCLCLRECSDEQRDRIANILKISDVRTLGNKGDHFHIPLRGRTTIEQLAAVNAAKNVLPGARLWVDPRL